MEYFFHDEHLTYIRKQHGVPSVFGEQPSFLDRIRENAVGQPERSHQQTTVFSAEDEYGLLNRLDNDTAGYLYFARTPHDVERYHDMQEKRLLYKRYLCDVEGVVMIDKTANKHTDHVQRTRIGEYDAMMVSYDIYHHGQLDDRMIVDVGQKKIVTRGEPMRAETCIIPLDVTSYEGSDHRITRCLIVIQQGVRHQIRVHCAALGYPLVGDGLYNKHHLSHMPHLHLWSIGMRCDQPSQEDIVFYKDEYGASLG